MTDHQTCPMTVEEVAEHTQRVIQEVEKAVIGKRETLMNLKKM